MAAAGNGWTHSLSDAQCVDRRLCVESFFCGPCVFGRNAEALGHDRRQYACGVNVPYLGLHLRTKIRGQIRERRGIEGSAFDDFMAIWCCGLRALIQETLEVRSMNMQRS